MEIYKFGGASVRDAEAVRNVLRVIRDTADSVPGTKKVVVVSAMGKTTNALEAIHRARYNRQDVRPLVEEVKAYHQQIADDLFGNNESAKKPMYDMLEAMTEQVQEPLSGDFDRDYDQLVCYGELVSTAIVNGFLAESGIKTGWVDARMVIRTDQRFRDARVDWNRSAQGVLQLLQVLDKKELAVTQGFIGSGGLGVSTTLGREGSDFTAAILAYLLDARSVTIWKDVPGMLNADPKLFPDAVMLPSVSYHEAIELAYYGASVIHPKTVKPLQNKNIPLYIRSFVNPALPGTVIHADGTHDADVASYIYKRDQVLISVSTRDFSFVVEDNLRDLFDIFASLGIRIHLMENSAISFSVVTDNDPYKRDKLFAALSLHYSVRYNEGLSLLTIRHYTEALLAKHLEGREVMLEQRSRHTVRLVIKEA
ncbi:MAG: aspartate kinase [Flavobacteriales bacterium]|nr:aspartate kinase [Flavobacteriales bacterium]